MSTRMDRIERFLSRAQRTAEQRWFDTNRCNDFQGAVQELRRLAEEAGRGELARAEAPACEYPACLRPR